VHRFNAMFVDARQLLGECVERLTKRVSQTRVVVHSKEARIVTAM